MLDGARISRYHGSLLGRPSVDEISYKLECKLSAYRISLYIALNEELSVDDAVLYKC